MKQRTERFEKCIEEFDDLQLQIDELSDRLDEQYKQRDSFESAFFGAFAKAKVFLSITSPEQAVGAGEIDVKHSYYS